MTTYPTPTKRNWPPECRNIGPRSLRPYTIARPREEVQSNRRRSSTSLSQRAWSVVHSCALPIWTPPFPDARLTIPVVATEATMFSKACPMLYLFRENQCEDTGPNPSKTESLLRAFYEAWRFGQPDREQSTCYHHFPLLFELKSSR